MQKFCVVCGTKFETNRNAHTCSDKCLKQSKADYIKNYALINKSRLSETQRARRFSKVNREVSVEGIWILINGRSKLTIAEASQALESAGYIVQPKQE